MATLEDPPAAAGSRTVGDVLREHRAEWAEALLGPDAVDLAAVADPAAALAGEPTGAHWLDGYDPAADGALARAAAGGVPLVVALPASTSAARLADRLGGAVVRQAVAAGSVIGEGEATVVAVQPDGADPDGVALVHANVAADRLASASGRLSLEAGAVLLGHLARVEEALASLQAANVRLGRERLGRHDAAAGTFVGRIEQRALVAEEQARAWEERFKLEQALAIQHHQWFESAQAKLNAPHHRAVERLYQALLRYSGMRRLIRLLKR